MGVERLTPPPPTTKQNTTFFSINLAFLERKKIVKIQAIVGLKKNGMEH